MKIISKIKDFYDWVVGIYGEDSKMVYDRRSKDTFIFSKYLKEKIYWDDKRKDNNGFWWISCWVLMGSRIWDFDFRPVIIDNSDPKLPKYKYEWKTPKDLIYEWENTKRHIWEKREKPHDGDLIDREKFLAGRRVVNSVESYPYSTVNISTEDLKIPVILCINWNGPLILNPVLKNTPLESFIPAEQAFLAIQDYIGSLKDMNPEDKRSDVQKLESAGFDKKTSFRKM